MLKIKKSGIFLVIIASIFLASIFLNNQKKIKVVDQSTAQKSNEQKIADKEAIKNNQLVEKIFVSGWLPYWKKTEGVDSLETNLNFFDEINPFAYGVDGNGNLQDTMQIKNAPWQKLRVEANKENVKIIPTIIWADDLAMHKIFSDSKMEDAHIENIMKMLEINDFSGVDIDYEGKNVADKEAFSVFLEKLHQKLQAQKKSLSCTVEARTQDETPKSLVGTRAMSFANDFSALNNFCDIVRLMAYDQMFQIYRSNIFEKNDSVPLVANADNQWTQSVVDYALRYISADKILLGIPTYGWEFRFAKIDSGYRYTRIKSVSYEEAIEKMKSAGVTQKRVFGELSFVYTIGDSNHIITYEDAETIRQKIELAKKNKLKGVSFFKLDGLTDPEIFSVIKKTM